MILKSTIKAITTVLNKLFPYNEPHGLPSVFMQDTWLEKFTRPLFIKDLSWSARNTK